MTDHVVIIGGGPGGYEAALVAAQLGAEVTVVDTDGLGGSAVLTDCVPSKTLIATAELMTDVAGATELGVTSRSGRRRDGVRVDLARVNARVKALAADQSADIAPPAGEGGRHASSRAAAASTAPDRVVGRPTTASRSCAPTRSWSPPAPRRARCPPRSPTASGSSPGSRSTTSTRCRPS